MRVFNAKTAPTKLKATRKSVASEIFGATFLRAHSVRLHVGAERSK